MISGIMQGLTALPPECAKHLWGLRGGSSLPTAPMSNVCPGTRLQCHYCFCSLLHHFDSLPCVERKDGPLIHTHQASKAEEARGDGRAQQMQRHCDLTASEVPKSKAREVKGLH